MSIFVPLNHFISRTNLLQPIGLLRSDGSLVSAMRNPLLEHFSSKIALDFRPRDNWGFTDQLSHEPSGDPLVTTNLDSGNSLAYLDGEGLTLANENTTSAVRLQAATDSKWDTEGKRAVWLLAYKIKSYDTATAGDTLFGEMSGGSGRSTFRPVNYDVNSVPNNTRIAGFHRYNTSGNFQGVLDPSTNTHNLDIITAASLDKWLLVEMIKNDTSLSSSSGAIDSLIISNRSLLFRILGGQFGSGGAPAEGPEIPDLGAHTSAWNSNVKVLPIHNSIVVAFATVAIYDNTNSSGSDGLLASDLTWTLFDREHVCPAYAITGDALVFNNVNGVAFELLINGSWVNTNGLTGSANRVFLGTGQHSIQSTSTFTAIRLILQNTGVMNADSLGQINWISVTSNVPSSFVPKPANHASFLNLSLVRGSWIEPNIDPVIDTLNRKKSDFHGNVKKEPGGGVGTKINTKEMWDPNR